MRTFRTPLDYCFFFYLLYFLFLVKICYTSELLFNVALNTMGQVTYCILRTMGKVCYSGCQGYLGTCLNICWVTNTLFHLLIVVRILAISISRNELTEWFLLPRWHNIKAKTGQSSRFKTDVVNKSSESIYLPQTVRTVPFSIN